MADRVLPDSELAEGNLRCAKCNQGGQFARLIVDPATSRRFEFFECTACAYPNWIETQPRCPCPNKTGHARGRDRFVRIRIDRSQKRSPTDDRARGKHPWEGREPSL